MIICKYYVTHFGKKIIQASCLMILMISGCNQHSSPESSGASVDMLATGIIEIKYREIDTLRSSNDGDLIIAFIKALSASKSRHVRLGPSEALPLDDVVAFRVLYEDRTARIFVVTSPEKWAVVESGAYTEFTGVSLSEFVTRMIRDVPSEESEIGSWDAKN